jgi:uncharacterized membrane protein HdeD (DUF308 family)
MAEKLPEKPEQKTESHENKKFSSACCSLGLTMIVGGILYLLWVTFRFVPL